ncbi:SLBB domain-containing protein [Roseivirga echinicomitans]|nr:SLBB domain-containing protein [Roseivirga echinicomitans]
MAQALPDFTAIKVDELSDEQIQSMMQKASSMGYSQQDLFAAAQGQGVSLTEISKLGQRMNKIQSSRVSTAESTPTGRSNRTSMEALISESQPLLPSEIFGLAIFQNGNAKNGFVSSLNIPTPENYVLGAGDEIFIDIYGSSEQYYQAEINPEGSIILENFGPIFLSGLNVKAAEAKIKNKLAKVITELEGESPSTFISVTLGRIRSINITVAGEVAIPGNYTMSAFSTVFNALYSVGGVTENGTLRNIKVFREDKLVAQLDAYDFLISGDSKSNIRLQSNDVIIIDPYTNRITVSGAVKRPAIYELKENESLSDLIRYAGGFSENAFSEQISVVRNVGKEKVVADVFENQYAVFTPKPGDVYQVKRVLDRFSNRVQIKGAVFRPGQYSISGALTAKQLIEKADGLKGDASQSRALIIRTNPDLSTETISINLKDLMDGTSNDVQLQREDVVQIFSIYDLKEESYVEVSGEVNSGGIFRFSNQMTIEDILILAGGFKSSASESKIEITRRYGDAQVGNVSEVFVVDVDRNLSLNNEDKTFELQPFDHIIVRKNPNFFVQKFVAIEGEVAYPGNYAIKNQTERISSLLERAGGVNQYAYIEGATLLRKTEFHSEISNIEQKVQALEALLNRYAEGDPSLSESELAQVARLNQQLDELDKQNLDTEGDPFYAKKERLREIVQRNALFGDVQLGNSDAIGIDLKKIIENPKSKFDLILEEGDVLVLPKQQETVRLRGRVLYPTTVVYEPNRSVKHFINLAGGFGNRAQRKNTHVIYANGKVAKTKKFLFFKFYPRVSPGAEIIVPSKPLKLPFAISEVVGITSGLATLALLISQINFSGK